MDNARYTIIGDHVLFTQLDEEGVLFDVRSNSYLRMNETFCHIFRALEEGKTPAEIKADLLKEYEVDEEICTTQIRATIDQLLKKDFIRELSQE